MIISQSKVQKLSFGLRTDQLWLVGILLVFVIVVSLMPVFPNDFWWTLKVGEIIHETGQIPSTNIFAWSLPQDHPYTYGSWLAGYLFFLFYKLGGIPLIIFFRNLLTVSAFVVIGAEAVRKSGSWRIAGIVTMLVAAMSSNNTIVRPQIFSWIPFVGFLVLLSLYIDKRIKGGWLLICPVLMAFWVNVHGSFILGLVLFGIFFAGEALRKLLKNPEALSFRQLGWIAIAGFLSLAATVINPKFFGIFGYVIKMMTDKPSQELILEWQSPTTDGYAGIMFFISVIIMLVVFMYSRYRPTITELLLIISFLWLALSGVRYVVWFGLIAMPILGKAMKEIVKDKPWIAPAPMNILNIIFVLILIIPAVMVQPWFVKHVPVTENYWKVVLRDSEYGPLLFSYTPIEAAEYLRENPGGKLFNEMSYGSYLIWAVPEQKVFIDPRVELYPYEQWTDYKKISSGIRSIELLDHYGADRALLSKEGDDELIKLLEAHPAWNLQYEDQVSQIWVKSYQ